MEAKKKESKTHQTFFLNTLTVEFDTYGSEKFDSLTVESFSTVEQTVEFWIRGFGWREATQRISQAEAAEGPACCFNIKKHRVFVFRIFKIIARFSKYDFRNPGQILD